MRPGTPPASGTVEWLSRSAADAPVLCDLFKMRLTSAVILTTGVSFYMGSVGRLDGRLMAGTLLATGLLACGAAAFNEFLECEQDGKMRRTERRPLPSGRLTARAAFGMAAGVASAGLIYLSLAVSMAAGWVGLVTLSLYLFGYTPLKRVTTLNTLVGAAPGALPAMIGWMAGRGTMRGAGWSLFAIVFLWQIPHFLSIGWMHRADYERAGFKILALNDPDGRRSGRCAVLHAACLVAVSICPFLLGLAGRLYLAGALLLGVAMFLQTVRFARDPSTSTSQRLFQSSVFYLPLLLVLMALGKTGETAW